MAPVDDKSPKKDKSPGMGRSKLKRIGRKALKRKKPDLFDSEWEEINETMNFDTIIEEKVNTAIDTIVDKVTKNLDEKLEKMVESHNKKIEDSIDELVRNKLKDIKQQCDKNTSDIAAQSAKINSVKTQSSKNKTELANHATKINKINQTLQKKNKSDISGYETKLVHLELQGSNTKEEITRYASKIKDIENSLDFYSTDMEELKQKTNDLKNSNENASLSVTQEHTANQLLTDVLIKRLNQEHESNLRHETYSRRNNVIIEGVKEYEYEDCAHIVSDICAKVLNLPDMYRYIDKAHRNGPKRSNAPRPIIARFLYHQDSEVIIARSSLARAAGLRIRADYPKEIQRDNVLLEKVHKLSLRDGKSTKLRGEKLFYNGKRYSVYDVHLAGLGVERIAERRSDKTVKFYGRFSKLSNFHPADLLYKGAKFTCAEQLYHYKRAERINDQSLALEILLAKDPADCKGLAKQIPEDRCMDLKIMREVIAMKFASEPFKTELKKTGNAKLMECNPYDSFWSTGTHMDESEPSNMRGENQLGVIIQEYRQQLNQNLTQ